MSPAAHLTTMRSRLLLLALWLFTAGFMLAQGWSSVRAMSLSDPDDALRLVQLRDLLAGQSWFDLTQYRLNPPQGVPMHWSRLVDLPLALGVLGLRPLLGPALAEQVTVTCVPLLYLLALFFSVRALGKRLGLGEGTALLGAALLATSISILIQFAPMRIDHHGPQILSGALAALALIGTHRRDGRMGLLAGLAMACWMQISMEGLPYAVTIGAIFGLRFLWRADGWADLRAYLPALTIASAMLLVGTHGWRDSLPFWCDAMSPAYLLPLAAVSAMLLVAGTFMPRATPLQRMIPLALAGATGIAVYLGVSRQCLAGPFATLDPLVHSLWYENVLEGMPIWRQKPDLQCIILLPALLGLAGGVIGLRRAQSEDLRIAWASLLVLQLAALAIALNVMRAMSFAHVVALPGNALLLVTLMGAAQRLSLRPLRVPLTAAVALFTPFGTATASSALAGEASDQPAEVPTDHHRCADRQSLQSLNALPASVLFTPIDIGSHLLAYTPHGVVGTGHHRNLAGMKAVLHAFASAPAQARTIVTATSATYLVLCPDENEARHFLKDYPAGLMAALIRHRTPHWLEPVPMRRGETIQVYRILRP